jgi:hydrogenase-1 operon protein HyaF
MNTRIPIQMFTGPGSQPPDIDEKRLNYLEMPKEMSTYNAPQVPQLEEHAEAQLAMDWLKSALAQYNKNGTPSLADLTPLGAAERDVLNQILCEGEVSVRWHAEPRARSQESVLTGVWRTFYEDESGQVLRDVLEVGPTPHYVTTLTSTGTPNPLPNIKPGEGVVNAQPLVSELKERSANFKPGDEGHTLNLTLLPMAEPDMTWLVETLGMGPVDALSRSYGMCHIQSTRLPYVWWVQYFNSMNKLILNTIEVTEIPDVMRAAAEDLRDSEERLAALLEPYEDEQGYV